jgi:hypothetical protein
MVIEENDLCLSEKNFFESLFKNDSPIRKMETQVINSAICFKRNNFLMVVGFELILFSSGVVDQKGFCICQNYFNEGAISKVKRQKHEGIFIFRKGGFFFRCDEKNLAIDFLLT